MISGRSPGILGQRDRLMIQSPQQGEGLEVRDTEALGEHVLH